MVVPRPSRADLWSAFNAAVLAVPLATLVVAAWPRTRGIGLHPVLRYALLTPACWLVVGGAMLAYRLATRARASEEPARSPWATAVMLTLGGLQVLALVIALKSERPAPRDPEERLAFDVPRRLFDVEHRFIGLPSGARVHYVDEGAGPTLLFLHGNPSWSFQWRGLIQGLRGSFRCVALDFPGFGLSAAPPGFGFEPAEQSRALDEFVSALGLRDVTLVMQDWGGPFGLGFAVRRPELVRDVVLGGTWAWPTTTAEPRGKFSMIVGGPLGEYLQVNFNAFASLGIQNGVVRKLPREELEVYLHPFRSPGPRRVAAYYPGEITRASAAFAELERELPRLADKRALIFWAGRDAGFPEADLRRWEQHFPKHRTVELPDADHFFFEDSEARMVTELSDFVAAPAAHGTSRQSSPR